jgi:hypothetical protein
MRKKKEKAKDFKACWNPEPGLALRISHESWLTPLKKTKLKVGKPQAKPDNFTDTSFKAKGT